MYENRKDRIIMCRIFLKQKHFTLKRGIQCMSYQSEDAMCNNLKISPRKDKKMQKSKRKGQKFTKK